MKFEFKIDRKCTIWIRESHSIDAGNYEQARERMIEQFRKYDTDGTFYLQEVEIDTLEDLPVSENDGWPTAELINYEGDTIADNTIKQTT